MANDGFTVKPVTASGTGAAMRPRQPRWPSDEFKTKPVGRIPVERTFQLIGEKR